MKNKAKKKKTNFVTVGLDNLHSGVPSPLHLNRIMLLYRRVLRACLFNYRDIVFKTMQK